MLAAGAKAAVNGETAAVAPPPKRRRTSSPCVLCPPNKSTGKPLYHQPGNCPTLKAQKKTAREAQQASRPQAAAAQSEPAVQATAEELAAYVEATPPDTRSSRAANLGGPGGPTGEVCWE